MGSSWSSSPLKSVMMLFQSELPESWDAWEEVLGRENVVLAELDDMTRLRSTSLTLMLRRLLRVGITLLDFTVSCVTVPVGDGVRARGCTTTIDNEWSTVSSISVSLSALLESGLISGRGLCRSSEEDGLEKTSDSKLFAGLLRAPGRGGTGGTGGGNASNTGGAVYETLPLLD